MTLSVTSFNSIYPGADRSESISINTCKTINLSFWQRRKVESAVILLFAHVEQIVAEISYHFLNGRFKRFEVEHTTYSFL